MNKRLTHTLSVILFLTALPSFIHAQEQAIHIRFLNAKITDTTSGKDLVAVFLMSTKDTAGFPPIINMPPKCTVFEEGREKVVLLNPHTVSLALYDHKVPEKNKEIYELIKDEIDLDSMQTSMIIVYKIVDLNFNFKKMSLTPSFKEKQNPANRVDKRCEFAIN